MQAEAQKVQALVKRHADVGRVRAAKVANGKVARVKVRLEAEAEGRVGPVAMVTAMAAERASAP